MNKHELKEYKFSKDVVEKFPEIKKVLDETYKLLYNDRQFLAVGIVLNAIEDSQEMIKRQYAHYKKVYENKGRE